jgi:hypothetical protein
MIAGHIKMELSHPFSRCDRHIRFFLTQAMFAPKFWR